MDLLLLLLFLLLHLLFLFLLLLIYSWDQTLGLPHARQEHPPSNCTPRLPEECRPKFPVVESNLQCQGRPELQWIVLQYEGAETSMVSPYDLPSPGRHCSTHSFPLSLALFSFLSLTPHSQWAL